MQLPSNRAYARRACLPDGRTSAPVGPASGPSRPARHRTAMWLASTGIAALLATGASAETIDSEVTVPGTRPSPFIVAGDLTVGAVTSGSLQIVDGGDVANTN